MPDLTFPVQNLRGLPVVTAPEEIDVTNADQCGPALPKTLGAERADEISE